MIARAGWRREAVRASIAAKGEALMRNRRHYASRPRGLRICDELVGPSMGARMRPFPDLAFLLVPGNGLTRLGTGEGGVLGDHSFVRRKHDQRLLDDDAVYGEVTISMLNEDARWLYERLARIAREEGPLERQLALNLLEAFKKWRADGGGTR